MSCTTAAALQPYGTAVRTAAQAALQLHDYEWLLYSGALLYGTRTRAAVLRHVCRHEQGHPSYVHSSNPLALCDTLVLGCHRVTSGTADGTSGESVAATAGAATNTTGGAAVNGRPEEGSG